MIEINKAADWHTIEKADDFLQELKEREITQKLLGKQLFGNTAVKVVRAVRKGGDEVFCELKNAHQIWWCTKEALMRAIEAKNTTTNQ